MARAWQRIAAVAFTTAFLVVLPQCKGLKPTPGGKCVTNGKYQCTDPSSALLCSGGTYVTLQCRGPRGCRGVGASSSCDDDLAQEGDGCVMTLNDNYACTTDHTKELICKDGKFAVIRSCKGLKKCTVNSVAETINCDDTLADVGDACVAEPGDGNYGCSVDKKTEVVCDAGSSKWAAYNGCRGQKGCWVEADIVHCDQQAAREGDPCHPSDNHSCSEDATAELKCSPQFKWVKQRDCKHDGCRVHSNEVHCN